MAPPASQHEDGPAAARPAEEGSRPPWQIRDMPERLRPREQMERVGAQALSDDALLAIILRSGVQGVNVVDLARQLIKQFGTFTEMARAPMEELRQVRGLGRVGALVLKASLEVGRRTADEGIPARYPVRTPQDVVSLLQPDVQFLDTEVFWVLLLDAKRCLKGRPVEITRGLLDASLVHPREVFRLAIRGASSAILLVHNHPSGDPTPSAEDLRITRQLVSSGQVLDVRVLDHIVLGRKSPNGRTYLSMREEGLVEFGGG